MKALNNKGFTLIELVVSVFVVSALVLMLLNYTSIQGDAFDYKNSNSLALGIITDELSSIYSAPDWSILTKDEETADGVSIEYSNYGITTHNTETITLTLEYMGEEWSYELERVE